MGQRVHRRPIEPDRDNRPGRLGVRLDPYELRVSGHKRLLGRITVFLGASEGGGVQVVERGRGRRDGREQRTCQW